MSKDRYSGWPATGKTITICYTHMAESILVLTSKTKKHPECVPGGRSVVSRKAQLVCFPESLPPSHRGRLVMQELPYGRNSVVSQVGPSSPWLFSQVPEDSKSTRPWWKAELENLYPQCGWAIYMQNYRNRSQVTTSSHRYEAKIYPHPESKAWVPDPLFNKEGIC